ncbi:hypothetical protein QCN27_20210 [Cereibacter sp. SYSU M97828]|nr:hypothetical protein [Cereibacter flavus]
MTDQSSRARSEKLVKFYKAYRTALDATPVGGEFMKYRWWTLPTPLNAAWMVYSQMLGEYATELANIINDLTNHVHQLRAWDTVLAGLDETDKHEVGHEFIETLGTIALGQPYAIKSRFAFAVGHLSHQANQAADGRDWKDEFPSKNLYLNDIEPYGSQWKKYRAFKLKLEPLAGKKFKRASDDFRNTYNHGFSSRFVVGMTATVKREVIGGQVRYAFGGTDPLTVAEVADLLVIERDHCYRAFEAFQSLVQEQIAAIIAVERGGEAASGGQSPNPAIDSNFFTFSPDTGDVVFRGKKVGSISCADGTTKVALNITYESQDENWILPLAWLGHGLRQAQLDQHPPIVLDMPFDVEDVELIASGGPVLLVEKTLKVDGRSWRFHKADADHWPSPLHGHDYDHGQVIDGITGAIYDKATKSHIGQLKPKKLGTMHEMLRVSKDLGPLAAQHLPAPPAK